MKNKVLIILLGAVVGFTVGYILFGQILGSHVSLSAIFDFSGGNLAKLSRSVGGVKAVQQKVFISAGVGAAIAIAYVLGKKK